MAYAFPMNNFEGLQRVTDEDEPEGEQVVAESAPQQEFIRITDDEEETPVESVEQAPADVVEGPTREEQLASLKAELTGEQAPLNPEALAAKIAENEAAMAPIATRLMPLDRLAAFEKRFDREARALEALAALRQNLAVLPQGVVSNIWFGLTGNLGMRGMAGSLVEQTKRNVQAQMRPGPALDQTLATLDKIGEAFSEGNITLPNGYDQVSGPELSRLARELKGEREKTAAELQEARTKLEEGEEEQMRALLKSMSEETESLRAQLPPKEEGGV